MRRRQVVAANPGNGATDNRAQTHNGGTDEKFYFFIKNTRRIVGFFFFFFGGGVTGPRDIRLPAGVPVLTRRDRLIKTRFFFIKEFFFFIFLTSVRPFSVFISFPHERVHGLSR